MEGASDRRWRSGLAIPALSVILLSQGCSLAWHDAHVHAPATSKSECPSVVRAVLDTVGAGAFAFLAGDGFVHRNDTDSAPEFWVLPFAAALAYAGSAAYGYVMPGRCERTFATSPALVGSSTN
ncbi:MAG TPA: hypothetical protein VMJ10_31475 [Kofleriaceae bacterium]|nr:hypothetical protein [Kofleriaceae bacterium]